MRCDSCCSYPNGYITLAPCLLSIVAYILTSIALYSCHLADTMINDVSIGLGMLYREISSDSIYSSSICSPYFMASDIVTDSQFSAAQGVLHTALFCCYFKL